jgi:SAM-dependent methyltransferase
VGHAYHDDRKRYFDHQCQVTAEHVIPFVEQSGPLPAGANVLEIGCGEAGVLKAFLDRGCRAVGVDNNGKRLARGRDLLATEIQEGRLRLLHQDAHTLREHPDFVGAFDLIVLKDVIEHVDDRPALLASMARLLRAGGRVFMAFPPWEMPFGGHQQLCRSRLLSRTPYFHLLPTPIYRRVLELFKERPSGIQSLLATKRTGISTAAFEQLVEAAAYDTLQRRFYVLNPMYSYRFGLPVQAQSDWVSAHSSWRDFVTSCAYYTLRSRQPAES